MRLQKIQEEDDSRHARKPLSHDKTPTLPISIIGHPSIGFVIGPYPIEIGRPTSESPE